MAYLFVPNVMASVVVIWQSENQLSLHSHSQLTNNLIQTTITVWSITTIALCALENTQFVMALTNKTINKYEIISVAILSLLFKWQQQRIVEARRRISLQRDMTARPRLRKWFAVVKFVLPEPKVPRSAQVCSSQQVRVVHQRRYKPAARLTRAIAQRSAHNATTVRPMHARCTLAVHCTCTSIQLQPSVPQLVLGVSVVAPANYNHTD